MNFSDELFVEVLSNQIRFLSFYSGVFYPHKPVAQNIADEVVFGRFQGEGDEFFFKSNLTDPPQIFDPHLLENTNLSPSSFHFSVGFLMKIMF